jgi:hypothetical protein
MTITYNDNLAVFGDMVSVEHAETLLQWIQAHPEAAADFSGCTHVHTANLQVLMATRLRVAAWPQEEGFRMWLATAMQTAV